MPQESANVQAKNGMRERTVRLLGLPTLPSLTEVVPVACMINSFGNDVHLTIGVFEHHSQSGMS